MRDGQWMLCVHGYVYQRGVRFQHYLAEVKREMLQVWLFKCAHAQTGNAPVRTSLAGKDSHGVALAHYLPGAGYQ